MSSRRAWLASVPGPSPALSLRRCRPPRLPASPQVFVLTVQLWTTSTNVSPGTSIGCTYLRPAALAVSALRQARAPPSPACSQPFSGTLHQISSVLRHSHRRSVRVPNRGTCPSPSPAPLPCASWQFAHRCGCWVPRIEWSAGAGGRLGVCVLGHHRTAGSGVSASNYNGKPRSVPCTLVGLRGREWPLPPAPSLLVDGRTTSTLCKVSQRTRRRLAVLTVAIIPLALEFPHFCA